MDEIVIETGEWGRKLHYHLQRTDTGQWWDAAAGGWVAQYAAPVTPTREDPGSFGFVLLTIEVSPLPPDTLVRWYGFADANATRFNVQENGLVYPIRSRRTRSTAIR